MSNIARLVVLLIALPFFLLAISIAVALTSETAALILSVYGFEHAVVVLLVVIILLVFAK